MEKQKIKKSENPLPIKTKIAAWITIIYGFFFLALILKGELTIIAGLIYFIISLICGIFLLKKKKIAWYGTLFYVLTIGLFLLLNFFYILKDYLKNSIAIKIILLSFLVIYLIPITFLLLDRKKIFKAVK
ncbi:MAG: hypothetical protein PHI88_00375 [Candidatus Pacebacteria bacterium]|nr:hypothetical protein [Candidatus Paceibacterota bacterium]